MKNSGLAETILKNLKLRGSRVQFYDETQAATGDLILEKIEDGRRFFKKHGVSTSSFVSVFSSKSVDECMLTTALLALEIKGVVVSDGYTEMYKSLLNECPVDFILVSREYLASFSGFESVGEYLNYSLLRNANRPAVAPMPPECRWCLLTSGSTGHPKVVMVTEANLVARAVGEIDSFRLQSEDRVLSFLNISHDLGLNQLLTSLLAGVSLYVHRLTFVERLMLAVDEQQITGLTAVPSFWRMFLARSHGLRFSGKSLKYVTVSGGSLTLDELNQIRSFFPKSNIIKTYGQTETFRSLIRVHLCSETQLDELFDPLKGVKLELHEKEGDMGTLVHSGVGTMLGYYPQDLGRVISSVNSGDLFESDENGRFRFIARKDSMIKINGLRFYPVLIESLAKQIPGIVQAAATVVQTDDGLESLILALETTQKISQREVVQLLKPKLPIKLLPDKVLFMEKIPLTRSFKIDYPGLKKLIP
jgi:acyl-coenzyme A synthetase/AMP-(fatty) acid ligase